jgi:L-ornithine Nalpha-acyltransferase
MPDSDLTLTQGSFFLHITRDPEEILKAQRLRYHIFFEEMSGKQKAGPSDHIDSDEYDPLCDHMIVYDQTEQPPKVIGTYRFLRSEFVDKVGKFYTETEFDLSKLLSNYSGRVVEVGRSCIDSKYRKGAVIKLLWSAIALYLDKYNLDLMFGCASFPGDDPKKHAMGLSYLHHFHRIDPRLSPVPLPNVRAEFPLLPKEAINEKRTFASLPPLIKGYLRLGGKVGDGAVIDHNVNTTDVCIIVPKQDISQRYLNFLSPEQN